MPKKSESQHLSSAIVATRAGIHKGTLLRWLRDGLIAEPHRDRHGWRVFSEKEATQIQAFAKSEQPPPNLNLVRETALQTMPVRRLQQIDWDFRDAKTSYLTHGLHPYPAKFIPQIPNALIQELSTIGNTVGDIFCGSGTTLVEALLLKRNAIGIDANPLACLITSAKTTRFQEGDKEALLELAGRVTVLANEIAVADGPTLFSSTPFVSRATRPLNEAIEFWFEPFVIEELAEILSRCRSLSTETSQTVALASFSAIIVNVSRQDSDTRYVRREKNLKPGDTLFRFAQVLTDNANAVDKFSELLEPNVSCQVVHADILNGPKVPKLDLVVCSPPYPNAYSYHLYHMTRMIWLGMDQPLFKRCEIGSHRKFSSNGKNAATIDTFKTEMKSIFTWLKGALQVGGHACFVVGNSTIRGKTFSNTDVIKEAASSAGFTETATLSRNLKDTAKAFNPKIGKIKTEQIVILENRGRGYL